MLANLVLNEQLKGVEIYFEVKPQQNIIDSLKSNGFRWHSKKMCWYAKQSEKTMAEAKRYTEEQGELEEVITPVTQEQKQINKRDKKEVNSVLSLWDLTRWDEAQQKELDKNLGTKEIASEVRKHVRTRFPFCKFSVRSDYSSIHFDINSSPFEKDSIYLKAIQSYCTDLMQSYKYCTCYDPYGDYGSSYNFYDGRADISYDYKQIDQTEEVKNTIIEFDSKLIEFEKAEEKRKEQEFEVYQKQLEQEKKEHEIRLQEEKRQIEIINNSVEVKELQEQEQYFVLNSQFANLNKNNTLVEYREEVEKGDFYLNNVKITREIHFTSQEALNCFSNLLLTDFSFLENSGGSYTDDVRINSMTDYENMTKEEQETVVFNLIGIAVYINNKFQFVIDTQGFSYARYVGLVDNVTINKNDPVKQLINHEELEELKGKAETLEDLSTEVILCTPQLVNTWDSEQFTEYKSRMKQIFNKNYFKITKSIIQQLSSDSEKLKVAMYKLLKEVDGIQDQFKNADLKQGQKLTLFYISDFGSMITSRITLDRVEYTKYAQYDDNVKLIFKPENKRKLHYNNYHSTILVYNNWLELPEEVLHDIKHENGMVITHTKYFSCDKGQYDAILEHFKEKGIKPIINTYKPLP